MDDVLIVRINIVIFYIYSHGDITVTPKIEYSTDIPSSLGVTVPVPANSTRTCIYFPLIFRSLLFPSGSPYDFADNSIIVFALFARMIKLVPVGVIRLNVFLSHSNDITLLLY